MDHFIRRFGKVARTVADARVRLDLTKAELARRARTSDSTIRRIEAGEYPVSAVVGQVLAELAAVERRTTHRGLHSGFESRLAYLELGAVDLDNRLAALEQQDATPVASRRDFAGKPILRAL
jgi:hypothetical protein